ncbi:short-chain dehydrogenase, partial [Vibrio sp. 1580]|nr:short-chain dehydrogenase [Vibrio sp. 1580]
MAHSVFITGANRGIGLSLTELYLERGWNVLATSRNVTDSDELQALRAHYS